MEVGSLDRLRTAFRRLDIYDALSLGLIALLFALALANWSKFPIFRDIYYHMGTARSFGTAGGIALHDFWEFAPVGRPHLYPPLLHVVMYSLDALGLSPGAVGRLVSFSAFHMVLLSTWYGMRRLFSSRPAFYSTVLLSSCFVFFWQTAVTSAASLVLIIAPFIFISLEEDRKVAAAVLLALALYSHLVLGHIIALGMFIYALHRWRERLKDALVILAGAYALWLPWGVHILVNYKSLSLESPMGAEGLTLHLLLWATAAAGFVYCYFKKGRYFLLPSLLLGMVPILFFYPHRFWDGHVFVPLAMLGGVALSALHGLIAERAKSYAGGASAYKVAVVAAMAVPVALLLLVDPVFATKGKPATPGRSGLRAQARQASPAGVPPGGGMRPPPGNGVQAPPGAPPGGQAPNAPPGGQTPLQARASTLLNLLGGGQQRGQGTQQSLDAQVLLNPQTERLAEMVEANSKPDQVVHTPDASLGNLITGLTGRPSTGGMFREVQSSENGESIKSSYLVIVPAGMASVMNGGAASLQGLDHSSLEYVGEAGGYSLYRNRSVTATGGAAGTVIPWWVVFPLLALALAAIAVDWLHPIHLLARRAGPEGR